MRHGLIPARGASTIILALAVTWLLAGCQDRYSPNTYTPGAMQQAAKVDRAVVESLRAVDVHQAGLGSGIGVGAGAAGGAIAGAQAGNGSGSAAAALGGALIGGAIGLFAEDAATATQGYEYILRKENGDLMSIAQKDEQPLTVGQKVLIVYGWQARVIPDSAAATPAKTTSQ